MTMLMKMLNEDVHCSFLSEGKRTWREIWQDDYRTASHSEECKQEVIWCI